MIYLEPLEPLPGKDCITVKQLKEFILNWPETDPVFETDAEVWIGYSGNNLSNPCKGVFKLNGVDIIIEY